MPGPRSNRRWTSGRPSWARPRRGCGPCSIMPAWRPPPRRSATGCSGRSGARPAGGGRGGGRSRPLAAAGGARPQPLGGRRAARPGARPGPRDPRGTGCRAGDRRDRLSQAGHLLLRRAAAMHRLGGQDHQLPDRRARRLRVGSGPRLPRSPALPAQELDRPARPLACRSCARWRALRHHARQRRSSAPPGIGAVKAAPKGRRSPSR
jgi:hypothetical protein